MNLVKTSLLSALQTATKIVAAFVVMKAVAKFAGPAGVAQLGQFQNFVAVVVGVAGGCFNQAITKYAAEYRGAETSRTSLYSTVCTVALGLCAVSGVGLYAGSDWLAIRLLTDSSLSLLFKMFGAVLLLTVLNGLLLAALNGEGRIREYIGINMASSVVMLVCTVVLASLYGTWGALLSLIVTPAITFVASIVWLRKDVWTAAASCKLRVDAHRLRQIATFGAASLVSMVALPSAQLVIRNAVVDRLSWQEAGLWQGMVRISDVYLLLITSSFAVYLLPKVSELQDGKLLKAEIRRVLALAVPASMAFAVPIYILRDQIIAILFTDSFASMRELFGWQLCGDVVKVASWVFAYVLLARAKVVAFIVGEVVFSTSYAVLSILFLNALGLKGLMMASFINYVVYFLYVALMAREVLKTVKQVNP